jgi:hypothetical protein
VQIIECFRVHDCHSHRIDFQAATAAAAAAAAAARLKVGTLLDLERDVNRPELIGTHGHFRRNLLAP